MSTTIRAILVDDEGPARKWLRSLLAAHPEISLIGEADGVESAITLAGELRPDVIFLDVQMPPGNGFDVVAALQNPARIVFVTAHDAFAVRAFEANALDYLLKPVRPERLAECVRRLLSAASTRQPTPSPRALGLDDVVSLEDRGILRLTPVRDIVAIEAEAAYTRIWLEEGVTMLTLRKISDWEQQLPASVFVRVGRSLMVNLQRVVACQALSRDETRLTLRGAREPFVLGRSAAVRLRRLLRAGGTSEP